MSGPNNDYDPVEVTPLQAAEVEAARDAAIAAIEQAGDLEALKQARLDHAGDRSPLALANREIGALPPQARKDAGQRIGQARGAVNKALAARQVVPRQRPASQPAPPRPIAVPAGGARLEDVDLLVDTGGAASGEVAAEPESVDSLLSI